MELLQTLKDLAEQKEIPYTKRQLEKMTEENLKAVYEEYKKRELDEFNEAMTDVVTSKFDEYMKKYNLIKEDSELGRKLQDKKLFRKDLKEVISYISPFLPFIGFIEGAVCVASEVVENLVEKEISKENKDVSPEEESNSE